MDWGRLRSFSTRLSGLAATKGVAGAKEYATRLPAGYPAKEIVLRLSLPMLPRRFSQAGIFTFSDHETGCDGRPTDTVVAASRGQFALSRDLGRTWEVIPVRGRKNHRIVNIKILGDGMFLAQTRLDAEKRDASTDLVVLNERGNVLSQNNGQSFRWHGCRAAARSLGVLMYAEYPHNKPANGRRPDVSRVFRSRDNGDTWHVAFERSGDQIRHFHFLQPRPGFEGEWWLASGDHPGECHVWVSKDDGDTWSDLTSPAVERIDVGGQKFERDIFRLTDLAWDGDEVIWGTDDTLSRDKKAPAAGVFRSAIGPVLKPHLVGRGKWHFRSLVDVGDFYIAISQGSPQQTEPPDFARPGVFLVPKKPVPTGPGIVHLFDVEMHSPEVTKLTASKASRVAKDGTFFTLREEADVFASGPRILRWDVSFN